MRKSVHRSVSLTALSFVFGAPASSFAAYNNATQWSQIGWAPSYTITVNGTPQTITPTGKGVTVGVIDTGATPAWVGNVSGSIIMGKCMLSRCPNSLDDNGHGTFVASEIASSAPGIGMTGIANGAKVLAVKVLNSSGSGSSANVANGIIYAANSGAQVLNLSLGPTGTPTQQAAFYSSIASAVNYAASKGVFVVFAGGNSSQVFSGGARITGFTDKALQRMLFVGSVDSGNSLSSFSNTPGTAGFVSSTNKFYAYNSMWVMADGENLWGASNYYTPQYGYSYITQMSGTSMAAPQAAASVALLESQWPILRTNGTATKLLEATAKDLGSIGVDATYGSGIINLTEAMQPQGTMTVVQSNGKKVPLSNVTGQMILGGAFGGVSSGKIRTALQAALAHYTTFDGYSRNFLVNLSGLVAGAPSASSAAAATAKKTTVKVARFADGGSFAYGNAQDEGIDLSRPSSMKGEGSWFMSYTDAAGSTMAAGAGFPSGASFAGALWGSDNPAAEEIYALGASSAVSTIAQGGSFFAYGTPLSGESRMAFSWSQTQKSDGITGAAASMSSAFSSGITQRLSENWQGGLTLAVLDQKEGLLDSSYTGNALSLGETHKSFSFGVTSTYSLSPTQDLLFDAAILRTDGGNVSEGLITGTSIMYARSLGAAYLQRDALKKDDSLTVSLRAPLRVFSGSVSMLTTGVDGNGLPVTSSQRIDMAPSGNELDLTLGYQAPVQDDMSWNVSVTARHDADNVAGAHEGMFHIGGKLTF